MRALLQPWRDRRLAGAPLGDVVLAGLLLTIAVVCAVAQLPPEGTRVVTVPTAILTTSPLAYRRRLPFACCAGVMAAATVQSVLTVPPGSLWAFAAFLLVTYSVAAHRSEGVAAAGGALVVAGLFLQEWLAHTTDYVFVVLVFAGTWLLGRAVRTWRQRAVTAEAAINDRARLAVAEERLRLARDLHDSVAHGLAVIAVQAEAAQAALERDPSLAGAPVAAIRASARTALDEMRATLDVLRAPGTEEPDAVSLTESIEGLVATVRAAGLEIATDLHGLDDSAGPVPTAVATTILRVVQEALTNALKHGSRARATRLIVHRTGDEVRIEVSNATGPRGQGTGHGLPGLRERVLGLDGTFRAGDRGGVFRVEARLPLSAPPPVHTVHERTDPPGRPEPAA